jgi:hypothetical protein
MVAGFGAALFAMTCFVVAGIIVAPGIAGALARPAGGLFFPAETFTVPPPDYGPADAAYHTGRSAEALAGYIKIIESYPGEFRAYAMAIRILLFDLRDEPRARDVLRQAEEALTVPEERAELARLFAEYRTEAARHAGSRRRKVVDVDD